MPKPALEFFPLESVDWAPVSPGVWERVLARDDDGVGLTRILRWDPGLDTSPLGPVAHDHVEKVLILRFDPRSHARCHIRSRRLRLRATGNAPRPVAERRGLRDVRSPICAASPTGGALLAKPLTLRQV